MIAIDEATQRQVQASDPTSSTWLSANAGSGKTRVLTDRVARLLLQGVAPQNILCLTFTKAAASEMQNRLFQRLGEWSMYDDTSLSDALEKLGVDELPALSEARTLFARAIETPGGLKIQTIHSFCATILRTFPLEAQISPRFVEMDESGQSKLLEDVGNDLATRDPDKIVSDFLRICAPTDLAEVLRDIARHREGFSQSKSFGELLAEYGAPEDTTEERIIREIALDGALLDRTVDALSSGLPTDQKAAARLAEVDAQSPDLEDVELLEGLFLFKGGKTPFAAKIGTFPTRETRDALGEDLRALEELMIRVERARVHRIALVAARRTLSLQRFAGLLLPAYAAAKQARGLLDFDDLIERTAWLLESSSAAQWVMYRLDGGIDHILVDEAQDTSPAQWKVIELLTREFGTGAGAAENPRSFFVVGDRKQSIYSFQGADAEAFDRMKVFFRDRLASEGGLQSLPLEFSFRSSPAILEVVDETICVSAARSPESGVRHRAFFANMAGRVDLWPLLPRSEKPQSGDWTDPNDQGAENHPAKVLADNIATELHRLIKVELATIPVRPGRDGLPRRRRMTEGDVLILVQGRQGAGQLFQSLILACKAKGLRVAGADRLRLTSELAVRDLRALLAFLALPEDSLSLAAALRSPLLGWTENDLFRLAARRKEAHLWETLRKRSQEHPRTIEILTDLRNSADFLRPYDLLERILIKHDGRRKLLARLGLEVEDGIDELLNLALVYEKREPPSLTGFLAWIETEDVEIKRQIDTSGDMIQVMTVHGAKGLERPVVILPDTQRADRSITRPFIRRGQEDAHWKPNKGETPAVLTSLVEELEHAEAAERSRLLYVAMTRAESWLIVCGAESGARNENSWHESVSAGMKAAGAISTEFAVGRGLRHERGDWHFGEISSTEGGVDTGPSSSDWKIPSILEKRKPGRTYSPSDLGGSKALPAESALDSHDRDQSLERGRCIHLLLEHLPNFPEADRRQAAQSLLSSQGIQAEAPASKQLVENVCDLLRDKNLRTIFSSNSMAEIDFYAELADPEGLRVQGVIDRLVIDQDRVLAIDFKTNLIVPDTPDEVPEGILRQMGAYLSALHEIYPDRKIDVGILWTETIEFMLLPHDIVMAALRRSTIS